MYIFCKQFKKSINIKKIIQTYKPENLFVIRTQFYFEGEKIETRDYYLLEFVIQNEKLRKGKNRLNVVIRNEGDEVLRNIILLLSPVDKTKILVEKNQQFIHALIPGKATIIGFPVSLKDSCSVFLSVTGFGNADDYFNTKSLPLELVVENIAQDDIRADS